MPTLEMCGCARGVRKRKCACVCASGEVFCVHTPSFSELRLAGRETQLKKKNRMAVRSSSFFGGSGTKYVSALVVFPTSYVRYLLWNRVIIMRFFFLRVISINV